MSKKRVELLNCLKEKAEDIFKELPVKFAVDKIVTSEYKLAAPERFRVRE